MTQREFKPDPVIPYLAAKDLFRQFQALTACLQEIKHYYPELDSVALEFGIAEGYFLSAVNEYEYALEADK